MELARAPVTSIAEKIEEIKRFALDYGACNHIMKGAYRGYNPMRIFVYFSAPLTRDQLDKGIEPEDTEIKPERPHGVAWGDRWYPLISTRIGANLQKGFLLFAMNDKLTPLDWQEDENQVYEFLSTGREDEDRSVLAEFAIEYNAYFREETFRPYLIHRLYTFLSAGKPYERAPIAGTFENTSPRLTHLPGGYKGEFRFIPDLWYGLEDEDEDPERDMWGVMND